MKIFHRLDSNRHTARAPVSRPDGIRSVQFPNCCKSHTAASASRHNDFSYSQSLLFSYLQLLSAAVPCATYSRAEGDRVRLFGEKPLSTARYMQSSRVASQTHDRTHCRLTQRAQRTHAYMHTCEWNGQWNVRAVRRSRSISLSFHLYRTLSLWPRRRHTTVSSFTEIKSTTTKTRKEWIIRMWVSVAV